jgi:hypothetical protein
MTLEQVFWASQILAAVGIICSLIYVGLQVRGSMKAVRAATEQACQENLAGIYVSLQNNPSALGNFIKGVVDYGELTPAEKAQLVCSVMAIMVYNQNAFDQWRVGHLRADLWAGWESLMMNIVHTPGGAAIWRERGYAFTKDFQDEVKRRYEWATAPASQDLRCRGCRPKRTSRRNPHTSGLTASEGEWSAYVLRSGFSIARYKSLVAG